VQDQFLSPLNSPHQPSLVTSGQIPNCSLFIITGGLALHSPALGWLFFDSFELIKKLHWLQTSVTLVSSNLFLFFIGGILLHFRPLDISQLVNIKKIMFS
jgi:hypothetical protein